MVGEFFIKKVIRSRIEPVLKDFIKNEKVLEECVEGLTVVCMEVINIIGIRQTIWYLWYAKKQLNIQRVLKETNTKVSDESSENATKDFE